MIWLIRVIRQFKIPWNILEIPQMPGANEEGSPKSHHSSPQVWHKLHLDQHLVQWNANLRKVKLLYFSSSNTQNNHKNLFIVDIFDDSRPGCERNQNNRWLFIEIWISRRSYRSRRFRSVEENCTNFANNATNTHPFSARSVHGSF